MLRKPVAISFSPNFQRDDVLLAATLLPGLVFKELILRAPQNLKTRIKNMFPSCEVFLFSSGRAALYYALRALDLKEGDEVLLQAFTCVAVPNAVLWAGLKPVFVDIDNNYNIDPKDIVCKISLKTKAVIVQHTFGIPARMDDIRALAKQHGLLVVEDCAHALGGTFRGEKLGTMGDVAILSFGRDKVVSSVFGGAVLAKNPKIKKSLEHFERNLIPAPWFFVTQQLFYPIIYAVSLPLYSVAIGKILLRLGRMFGLLSRAVYEKEKEGIMPQFIKYSYAGKLCVLADHQLAKLDRFTQHREKISEIYIQKLGLELPKGPYLRMPYIEAHKKAFLLAAQHKGLHLGNWYRGPVDPLDTNLSNLNYSSCPHAEKLAAQTINLPTHINISTRDAHSIVIFIQKYQNHERHTQ